MVHVGAHEGHGRRPERVGTNRVWTRPSGAYRKDGPACERDDGYKYWVGAEPNPPYEVNVEPHEIASSYRAG
jgi:hypothetical protein